jgi:hypothetical protein
MASDLDYIPTCTTLNFNMIILLGIESQFATNHVALHYLTILMLPPLEKSGPSCVVTVSSIGHRAPFKKLNLESISDPAKYNKSIHYGKSKVTLLVMMIKQKNVSNLLCTTYIGL